ncbi:hypothetical protein B566_EDAN002158, partial [Ephemera danica]
MAMEAGVVRSPVKLNLEDVPEVPLSDFLLSKVASHLPHLADTPWVVDFPSGSRVLYGEVEIHSRHVAGAIAHYAGFKRGDVLYSSVYDCSHLYVVMLAAWRLGGVTRSCYQLEDPAEVARQMRETRTRLVLMDRDTAPLLLEAASSLEWPVTFLSVGRDPVPNTIYYTQLLNFDLSEFPNMKLQDINVREDVVVITSTTGSTGKPRGVMHSHFAIICTLFARSALRTGTRHMTQSNIDNIANWMPVLAAITTGATIYVIPIGNKKQNYIDNLISVKIEPSEIEDVLKSHEAVLAAGVVGVPSPEVLNVTRAYVVLIDHVTVTADELKNFVAARLPESRHITGGICFVPDLPVNRNSKLD